CARCAAELEAQREIEALLATPHVPAPAGFTDRVMERVAGIDARVRALPALAPGLPWWVRAAADPAAVLAFALAALVAWKGTMLLALLETLGARWGAAATGGIQSLVARVPVAPLAGLGAPVVLGLELALAPAVAWASWRLWKWFEELPKPRP